MVNSDAHGVAFVTLYGRIIIEIARNPRISQELLARRLEVTVRTVQRHLAELEREQYLYVNRDRKPNTYEIAWDRPIPFFGSLTLHVFRHNASAVPRRERTG